MFPADSVGQEGAEFGAQTAIVLQYSEAVKAGEGTIVFEPTVNPILANHSKKARWKVGDAKFKRNKVLNEQDPGGSSARSANAKLNRNRVEVRE